MKKYIISSGLIALTLAGGGVYFAAQPEKVQVQEPLVLKWDRPKTDEEWNKDVKLEYVDIRGTEVLGRMLEGQVSKLAKNEKLFERFTRMEAAGADPITVLTFEEYETLSQSQPQMTEEERLMEARANAEMKYNQMKWEIEKNKQSIERIEKELELREKGFVKVKGGTDTPTDFFGAELPEDRVRITVD